MIEFTPDRLEIRNFRGLPSIDLDIHSGAPAFLIGPNNSGKSTVLNAMAFALKGGGFHKFAPQPYDFLHHPDGAHADRFSIRLYFRSSDQLPSVHTVGTVTEVHALEVEGRYYKTSGRLEHTHRLLDNDGKPITLVTETQVKKEVASAYAGAGHGYKLRNAHYGDIREFLPEVWLLSAKNLQPSLYAWKTGPLSKLASLLSKKFFQESWEFEHKGKKRKMPTGIEQAHEFFFSAVKEFPFWKETLKPAMESAMSSYLGSQTSIQLNPLIQSVEDWLRQQLLLSFAAESGNVLTPLDRMGDGFQSLVRLASLEVLAEIEQADQEKVVMLYEEPETYLHPHLRRKLRTVFDQLAKKGWTILCATHAPEFVSFVSEQSIHRLVRAADVLTYGHVMTARVPENLKFQEKLDEYGNHEIFFAQRIVFCEGKDDVFAIRSYLELSKLDCEARSISIAGCEGVENMPDFARIAKSLNIPFFAVTDLDKDDTGQVKARTQTVRDKISAIAGPGDDMGEWENTLEECFDTPMKQNGVDRRKAAPSWQQENVFSKRFPEIRKDYPRYSATCETILSWASPKKEDGA